MYGRRFDYKDPTFQAMIKRDHEVIHFTGSPSIQVLQKALVPSLTILQVTTSTVTHSLIKLGNNAVKPSAFSLQIYNVFPWLGPFLKTWRYIMKNVEINIESTRRIIGELKETLNPGTCRCFVDAFLIHKENLEVRNFNSRGTAGIQNKTLPRDKNHSILIPFVLCTFNSDQSLVFQECDVNAHYYHEDNLLHSAMNLFGAGTDTTAITLQWGLLYITKYPHIQGAK